MSLYVNTNYWNTGYGDARPYGEWLTDPKAVPTVLVVATVGVYNGSSYVDTKLYFSTQGFLSSDAAISFKPIIVGNVGLTESLSIDGGIGLSFGDIQLSNLNGELDEYLDASKYIWTNKAVKIFHGDVTWAFYSDTDNEFFTVFDGIINDIDSASISTLNINFRDKLERLNAPVTENKIGTYGVWASGQQNADQIRPVVFGEVFNMSPVLIDPSQLEFLVGTSSGDSVSMGSNGACESIIEIRDNGVPVYTSGGLLSGAVVSLSNSTFKLTSPSQGTLTASVQGLKTSINLVTGEVYASIYDNNLVNYVAVAATQFGKADTRLTVSDIDLPNFNYYYNKVVTEGTANVGIVVSDTTSMLALCRVLAESAGLQVLMDRRGKLQLQRYGEPYNGPGVSIAEITEYDMVFGSFSISKRLAIESSVKIGYAKNWTVQPGLVTAIPDAHKESMATEWLTVTSTNSAVKSLYKQSADPVQKDTYLITTAAATSEANRQKDYFSQKHTVYKFTGSARLLPLVLGQQVTLTHTRYGLSAGVVGQIVSLSPSWTAGRIDVEVLV